MKTSNKITITYLSICFKFQWLTDQTLGSRWIGKKKKKKKQDSSIYLRDLFKTHRLKVRDRKDISCKCKQSRKLI